MPGRIILIDHAGTMHRALARFRANHIDPDPDAQRRRREWRFRF